MCDNAAMKRCPEQYRKKKKNLLHLARLNLCPSVTGNGGTIFTPLQIKILQTVLQIWLYYIKTHHKKLSFGMFPLSSIYTENAF